MSDTTRTISNTASYASMHADRIECLLVDELDDLNEIIPNRYPRGYCCLIWVESVQECLTWLKKELTASKQILSLPEVEVAHADN